MRINTRNADKLELDAEQLVKWRTLLTLAVTSARMADMTGTYRWKLGRQELHSKYCRPYGDHRWYPERLSYGFPPVWLKDTESSQSNLQQAPVLRQQMPKVHHEHLLARGHGNELWARAEQKRIYIQIQRRKCGWIGHTLRKTNSNVTRHALRLDPQRKRSQDRPRNSWIRTVDDKARKAGWAFSMDLCSTRSSRE